MVNFEELAQAMGELDEDTVKEMLEEVMADGGSQAAQAMEACQKGMDIVGSQFESGEYFVGDLIFAGELMTDAVGILKDALVSGDGGSGPKAKMILCTVKDDLHDIGKNIVRSMLEAGGFEVMDLGIDVPPEKIVSAARENNISIVGLSGVLTLAIDSMKSTVEAFEAAGMRENTKIIIGGAPINESACAHVGADAWAINPQDTVRICSDWAAAV
ncbi:MAG: cobalamin-binding protein [Oscillibacter sp.]|nr:cobalamin-binding protein [Oscillibacter sp.]